MALWSSRMIRASGTFPSLHEIHCARSRVQIPAEPFFLPFAPAISHDMNLQTTMASLGNTCWEYPATRGKGLFMYFQLRGAGLPSIWGWNDDRGVPSLALFARLDKEGAWQCGIFPFSHEHGLFFALTLRSSARCPAIIDSPPAQYPQTPSLQW
jgi:hypothetical protein